MAEGTVVAERKVRARVRTKPRHLPRKQGDKKPGKLPVHHVVPYDSDDHTFPYVIAMLANLFSYSPARGFLLAHAVHRTGKVIVFSGHKELCELRRDQIHSHGPDPRIPRCRGSMKAQVVPAVGGGS